MVWEIDLTVLILRLIAGTAFVIHGYPKLVGGSRGQTIDIMKSIGVAPTLTTAIALLELVGGVFVILGILTRLVTGLLALEMVATIILLALRLKKKYILGYELDLAYLAIFLGLALLGGGAYSLDELLGLRVLPFVA